MGVESDNKERLRALSRARNRRYYAKHRERLLSKNKAWRSEGNRQELLNSKNREYYRKNRESVIATTRAWASRNKERVAENKRRWAEDNADHLRRNLRKRARVKRAMDPQYRIYSSAVGAISCLLRGRWSARRGGIWVARLGCTPQELREHLERQFEPGMTWENRGTARNCWQVDHIKAASQFDLTDETQLREFFHYTNTRPLWQAHNKQRTFK